MSPPRLRSLLFAPGTRPDVVAKTPRSGPDGVVVDLEDAVPPGAKEATRAAAREASAALVGTVAAVFVRVNALPTPWFAGDMAEALHPGLTGVVVPKLEDPGQVATVRARLDDAGVGHLLIVAGIETAAGVARAEAVLGAGVEVAYFGAEDYTADVGGVRTPGNLEVLYARSRVALAARLTGVVAIDQVVTALDDPDTFRRDAAEGRALGYRGKLLIHPAQVALAHEAFSPSPEEVERARRLVDAYEAAAARGEAAVQVDGQMVDEPVVRRARAVLDAESG